jgi:hypothetical protein
MTAPATLPDPREVGIGFGLSGYELAEAVALAEGDIGRALTDAERELLADGIKAGEALAEAERAAEEAAAEAAAEHADRLRAAGEDFPVCDDDEIPF